MCFHVIFISDFFKFSFSVINHFNNKKYFSFSKYSNSHDHGREGRTHLSNKGFILKLLGFDFFLIS